MNTTGGILELNSEHQSQGAAVNSSDVAIVIGRQILDEFDHFYADFMEIVETLLSLNTRYWNFEK